MEPRHIAKKGNNIHATVFAEVLEDSFTPTFIQHALTERLMRNHRRYKQFPATFKRTTSVPQPVYQVRLRRVFVEKFVSSVAWKFLHVASDPATRISSTSTAMISSTLPRPCETHTGQTYTAPYRTIPRSAYNSGRRPFALR